LGAIGPEAAVAAHQLTTLVEDGVTSVRRNAAAALGKIGPSIGNDAVQTLIGALDDRSQLVREQAVIALGRLGDLAKPAAPAIEEVLKDGSGFAARSKAAETLWRLSPESSTPLRVLLTELQGDDDAETAAHVLGEIGNELGAVEAVGKLLTSPKTYTRLHAAWALGLMGQETERATAVLKQLLDDPEPDYRQAAEVALRDISRRHERTDTSQ
jgi:HEAT repeat protein